MNTIIRNSVITIFLTASFALNAMDDDIDDAALNTLMLMLQKTHDEQCEALQKLNGNVSKLSVKIDQLSDNLRNLSVQTKSMLHTIPSNEKTEPILAINDNEEQEYIYTTVQKLEYFTTEAKDNLAGIQLAFQNCNHFNDQKAKHLKEMAYLIEEHSNSILTSIATVTKTINNVEFSNNTKSTKLNEAMKTIQDTDILLHNLKTNFKYALQIYVDTNSPSSSSSSSSSHNNDNNNNNSTPSPTTASTSTWLLSMMGYNTN